MRNPGSLMRTLPLACAAVFAACANASAPTGRVLEEMTWNDAAAVLTPETIVVIPLGAASKEHGPHLRLDNDLRLAQYFTRRILDSDDVVVAPTITYHFYPAFVEYPGSTTLQFETARDVVVDIVRSLANHGPRRFYVLNTGVSTLRPLEESAAILAKDGILLRFTNVLTVGEAAVKQVETQARGTHADEIETSMMLYIDPSRVDMRLAVRDDNPRGEPGGLTRTNNGKGIYSASGVWGDATLASREKGRIVVEAMVEGIRKELAELRGAAVPPRD